MVPLGDVQGLILRSYGMDCAAFFLLRVGNAAAARKTLGNLSITAGTLWDKKPDFCINIALTFDGLSGLGLSPASLGSFPEEFVSGAFRRCAEVGDFGSCSADNWDYGLGKPGLHALLLLFAQSDRIRDAQTTLLRQTLLTDGGWSEIAVLPGDVLPGSRAHFGYRDGLSQPTIDCGLGNPFPDTQPVAPPGEFLLGYPSQFEQLTYAVPVPDELGRNGSFMVLRILEQDCAAFDASACTIAGAIRDKWRASGSEDSGSLAKWNAAFSVARCRFAGPAVGTLGAESV